MGLGKRLFHVKHIGPQTPSAWAKQGFDEDSAFLWSFHVEQRSLCILR